MKLLDALNNVVYCNSVVPYKSAVFLLPRTLRPNPIEKKQQGAEVLGALFLAPVISCSSNPIPIHPIPSLPSPFCVPVSLFSSLLLLRLGLINTKEKVDDDGREAIETAT
jgi:hypothetical protein